MGNLYDYFSAVDDHAAAETFLGAPDPDRHRVLPVKGIDPIVQLGTLEALLRDVAFDEVAHADRHGDLVTDPQADSCWVVTLTDTLRDALADASAETLAEVARPWSQTEEFWGDGDPEQLADFLGELADMARDACERGLRLYCWMSL